MHTYYFCLSVKHKRTCTTVYIQPLTTIKAGITIEAPLDGHLLKPCVRRSKCRLLASLTCCKPLGIC